MPHASFLHYPVFWTNGKGFDYVLYNKLKAEANSFPYTTYRTGYVRVDIRTP
jgi:hypothetical protein